MKSIRLPTTHRAHWIIGLFFVATGIFLFASIGIAIINGQTPTFEDGRFDIFIPLGIATLTRGLWRWLMTDFKQHLITVGDILLGSGALLKFIIAPHALTGLGPEQIWLYDAAVACAAWCYAGATLRGHHVV